MIELSNRMMTVDFINKSIDGQRETTEIAEQLGQMNTAYHSLLAQVGEKIKMLDVLRLQWDEYEAALNNMRQWLTEQEIKVKKWNEIGHEISVTHTVEDLQVSRIFLNTK